jgi:hypothetical protein
MNPTVKPTFRAEPGPGPRGRAGPGVQICQRDRQHEQHYDPLAREESIARPFQEQPAPLGSGVTGVCDDELADDETPQVQGTPPASPPRQILPLLSDIARFRVLRGKDYGPVRDAWNSTPIDASVRRNRVMCRLTPVRRSYARQSPFGRAQGRLSPRWELRGASG